MTIIMGLYLFPVVLRMV